MPDPNQIGQDRQFQTDDEAHKAESGEYADNTATIPDEERFQESNLPKAPDPSPFKLGPLAPGGR